MKLLFFSTAALMTVAYASKAAVQQAANSLSFASVDNSCNWIQESSPACAPSNVPEIVNVYNYYEYNGC